MLHVNVASFFCDAFAFDLPFCSDYYTIVSGEKKKKFGVRVVHVFHC